MAGKPGRSPDQRPGDRLFGIAAVAQAFRHLDFRGPVPWPWQGGESGKSD
jgi:hypothetical protein